MLQASYKLQPNYYKSLKPSQCKLQPKYKLQTNYKLYNQTTTHFNQIVVGFKLQAITKLQFTTHSNQIVACYTKLVQATCCNQIVPCYKLKPKCYKLQPNC